MVTNWYIQSDIPVNNRYIRFDAPVTNRGRWRSLIGSNLNHAVTNVYIYIVCNFLFNNFYIMFKIWVKDIFRYKNEYSWVRYNCFSILITLKYFYFLLTHARILNDHKRDIYLTASRQVPAQQSNSRIAQSTPCLLYFTKFR